MKMLLNKLTEILIISLVSLLSLITIAGCKDQVNINITPETEEIRDKKENYEFITKWGSEGSWNGYFKKLPSVNPLFSMNIAVDKDGYIYITDPGNYRIQKFASNGRFIIKWSSESVAKETYKYFSSIAVDLDNNIYVTESVDGFHYKEEDKYFIQKFTSNGKFITKWEIKRSCENFLASGNKKVYCVYHHGDYLMNKYDSEGKLIKNCFVISDNGSININIVGIAMDSKSNIFALVSEVGPRFASDYSVNLDPNTFPPHKNFVMKMNPDDPYGDLIKEYEAIYDNKKKKLVNCYNIAIDSENNIFISGGKRNHCIFKYDSKLNFITKFGSEGELKRPSSIAVDKDGNIYVMDIEDLYIKKFAPKH